MSLDRRGDAPAAGCSPAGTAHRRPVAVRVIVVILLVQAALAMVAALLVLSVPSVGPVLGPTTSILVATLVEPTTAVIVVIALTVNAVWVAITVSLWRRRGGARTALTVLGGIGLLLALFFAFSVDPDPVETAINLVSGAGTALALLLLCRSDVRAWYRNAS